MVGLAEKARREGLLALEAELEEVEDDVHAQGRPARRRRHRLRRSSRGSCARRSTAWRCGTARTPSSSRPRAASHRRSGILGTVLSLVHVLENLSNPGALGHSIAGAFIATLYGVGTANLDLPADRQPAEGLSEAEVLYREMILEGVLALQAGDNPSMLAERLDTFLEPGERGAARRRAGCRRGARARDAGGGMSCARRQEAAAAGHGRRRKGDHGGHDGGDERWLLTYADMITLLMALFIVMWAISSVNTTKFAELSVSLKQAFNGKLVEGGDNVVRRARRA